MSVFYLIIALHMTTTTPEDLLCFSHLRWDIVFQRPQHLMTRFAERGNVYFLEEPVFDNPDTPYIPLEKKQPGLWVCLPHLPAGSSPDEVIIMNKLLLAFFEHRDCSKFIFWYYTPMAYEFSGMFGPAMTIYDCMDELAAFAFMSFCAGMRPCQIPAGVALLSCFKQLTSGTKSLYAFRNRSS
jgi:hypothetical protein